MCVLKLAKFLAVMEMDHMQKKGQQTHGNTSVFKWVAGLFTPVIHILDIGCTGVNGADMKSDS